MNHEIDLGKYQIRTDLAIEEINNQEIEGITSNISYDENIKITKVVVLKEGSINKKQGNYITIEFEDITDYNNSKKIENVFSRELKKLLEKNDINENDSCLIIGLGNNKSTPDALGPMAVENVLVTNHLFMIGSVEEGFRRVSALAPGVMGQTGLETSEVVISVVKSANPDFVIVIDALASQSIERVNRTIQMTDAGINPGSGIGNNRKEISKESIGKPVIAIGVPTVVDAITIVSDTINFMHKHFSYSKQNIDNPINRILVTGPNYLKKDVVTDEEDKKMLLGVVGTLPDFEIRQLLFEVLTPIGYNLMVTPKEVDFVIEKISGVIGSGINSALHKNVG